MYRTIYLLTVFLLTVMVIPPAKAQQSDSLVIKLYSGIGEHTLKPGYRMIHKFNYQEKYFRTKIVKYNQDTIFVKPVWFLSGKKSYQGIYDSANHLMPIPVNKISEIGYYTWQDKLIRCTGLLFAAGTAVFAITYFQGDRSSLWGLVVAPIMSAALLTMKRKTFRLPQPWKLQVTQEVKSGFIFH